MTLVRGCWLAVLIGLSACGVQRTNLNGTWKGRITDPGGVAHELTLLARVAGDTLRGSIVVVEPPASERPVVNGKVRADRVSFDVGIRNHGVPGRIAFAATVAGKEMKGVATGPEGGRFPFTLSKVSDRVAPPRPAGPPGGEMGPPRPQGSDPRPEDAQTAVLAAFDRYELVGGMSASHGNKDTDDFILALLRNPAFPGKVNDIAVECGNSLYQDVLDRYIAGEDVPLADVRRVWRNTTQPNCGFSAFYEQLFPLVRRINAGLPQQRRLRVLACDPPIDWSRVKSANDARPFQDRDRSIAAVIEKEVLARHRKALLLFGINHVRHGTDATAIFEQRYPGVTFVIADHHGFGGLTPLARYNGDLEKRMASWRVPSLVTMKDTWLADLDCAYFDAEYLGTDCHGYPGVDGYLYVGPRDLLLNEPASARIVLDRDYMAELRRRAAAMGPRESANLDEILKRESNTDVFQEEYPGQMAHAR